MSIFEQTTHAFIIRFWLEPREIPGTALVWRGVVEHVASRERHYFADVDELAAILRPYLEDMLAPRQSGPDMMGDLPMETGQERSFEFDGPALPAEPSPLATLQPALIRLDRLLAAAVLTAQTVYGAEAAEDPYRGLHIGPDEVARLLQREPAAPVLAPDTAPQASEPDGQPRRFPRRFAWLGRWFGRKSSGPLEEPLPVDTGTQPPPPAVQREIEHLLPLVVDVDLDSPFARLARQYNLSSFDLDVMLIALAPDLDLRYERLYAYLQDDVSRRRPSIDLVLNLLSDDAEEKIARRAHFSPNSPLVAGGLIQLATDRDDDQVPLLSRFITIDGQVLRHLIDEPTLDPRLAPFTELVEAEAPLPGSEDRDALLTLVDNAWNAGRPLRVYLQGQPGSGRRRRAEWLSSSLGISLLIVDLPGALAADRSFEWTPRRIFREAIFRNALVYLSGFDSLREEEHASALEHLWATLTDDDGVTLLAGSRPWVPVDSRPGGVVTVPITISDHAERMAQWQELLDGAGVEIGNYDVNALASRFRLTHSQIADAFATAQNQARLRAASQSDGDPERATPTLDDLFAAARAQRGHELATLARKIEPVYAWDDIVLPDDTRAQLQEICQRVAHGETVLETWGFAHKISGGKGTTALFAGPSGTGKTMAAEILAAELGLDLYKIDLSSVVSKYIGETEKNLERIFQAAENSNAILFFDEADALFGKRSEVRDSHDRYANIETSYLLQKMEEHDGIAILATNLRQNLDDSFVRRMAFTVAFPFPDQASRRDIWRGIWPSEAPRSFPTTDLDDLAARFRLSGGNIKNVALASAYLAAEQERPICLEDLLHAIQREYQKMGKTLTQDELRGTQKEVAA